MFTDRLPLIDYDAFRFRQNEFPNDFNFFVNDVSGSQFETNIVLQEDFMGLGLQFGIEFMLPIIKNYYYDESSDGDDTWGYITYSRLQPA